MAEVKVTRPRLVWLDALKGYGILMVMLSHLHGVPAWLGYLFAGYMPLFWMASGYVDNKGLSNTVLTQKAKRMLIPYLVYGVVALMAFYIIGGGKSADTEQDTCAIAGLLYSRFYLFPLGSDRNIVFLPMESTAPLWFLTSLFTGFCVYYLLFGRQEQSVIRDGLSAGGCFVATIALSRLPILLPWSLDMVFMVALFIWLGKKAKRMETLGRIGLAAVGCACLLIYAVLAYKNGSVNLSVRVFGNRGWMSVGVCAIMGTAYFLLVSIVMKAFPKMAQRPLAFIGNHSLRLMCIHLPVFFIIDTILPVGSMDFARVVMIKFAVAIALSWIVGLLIARSGNHAIQKYL